MSAAQTCPARRAGARFPRPLPDLRRAHAAGARVGRRVPRPLPRDVDRPTPEGRELWLLTLGPDPDRARPPPGSTATCTRASSAARASRWRSPRTCCACTSSRTALQPERPVRRGRRAPARRPVLRAAADVARRRRGGAHHRPLRALGAARRAAGAAHARWRRRATSTATGSRWRCASAIRAASSSSRREFPGLLRPAHDRRRAAVLQALSRRHHRELRRHATSRRRTSCPTTRSISTATSRARGRPTRKQEGAGAFPLSEPESRAVVEFATQHPEIFAWLNLHTFGGVFIRPLGDKPDTKMDQEDLALFRQLGAWAEELTGYPMVSGCEEFLYEPDKPLHGDLTDYAYHQRGAVAYVVELWDLFKRLGLERKKLRRPLRAPDARGHAEDRRVGPRRERGPRRPAVARVQAPAARRRRDRRHRSRASGCGIRRRRRCRGCARRRRRITCGSRRWRRPWRWTRSRPRRCRRS